MLSRCSIRHFSLSTVAQNKEVVILAAARTPIGSFRSQLASVSAPQAQLGSTAIKATLDKSGVKPDAVQEVFMGQVCEAGVGQAPARQATLGAGLSVSTAVTTVNKVCSSGLKAIMLAAQQVQTGHQDVVIGGGMESISQVPFYMARGDSGYGGVKLVDGIVNDGLTDAYDKCHMGNCGEKTSKELGITRQMQDEYAISSYPSRPRPGRTTRKGVTVVDVDEEFTKVSFDKLKALKAVFVKGGTITAGNASTLNDGAAAVLMSSVEAAKQLGVKPLAKILAYGHAATNPLDFAMAPPLVIPKMLKTAGLKMEDIDHWEVNEAFSCVPLPFIKQVGCDPSKVNPHGGAVSIGHPIGMSGARLITHLVHSLRPGQKGLAAICNGGGGASAPRA